MCLTIGKILFCVIAFLMTVLFSLRVFVKKDFVKQSGFVALIGGTFIVYVLCGLGISVFLPGLIKKIIMIIFAISPFIIGKLVSYEKLKFYSIIQILCVILSVVYVIFV